ncbi:MAG: hypothetical protein KAS21_07070, partial [Candidatus Aminicenantes bacterium]|nr:hypothetical protein [Candidatus Aminicenantes bacterium]
DAYSEIPDHLITDEENGRMALGNEMVSYEKNIVSLVQEFLVSEENSKRFPNYRQTSRDELKWHITLIYKLLRDCVRYNDNASFISYINYLASIRRKGGFPEPELSDAVCSTVKIAIEQIKRNTGVHGAEEILDKSIKPSADKIPGVIKKVYDESVII